MTACPPAEQLLELAAGRLSDDSQASVESHIDTCPTCRAALSALAKHDAANTSFGRYRLDTVLGSGGMGIVYRAWDPQLARPVAIKVVRQAGAAAELRQRLVREAQSLARLSHPNVCHVYDVGTEDEEVWVAMELVDGTTLRQWAVDRPFAELLDVLLGAAEGIAAAHASGLIHRDIKPENVLVTRAGRPVVTDFGLARVDVPVDPNGSTMSGDPLLTATGAIVGTPAYLAPEQLTGDTLDARVDQFAWAVMAWELLTGTRPFPIIAAIRLDAIRAGVTAPGTLPKPIADALKRAMALAPRDRWPSMRELIEALRTTPRRRVPRTPFVVGGAAVRAVAGTVIAWQALRDPEPTPQPIAATTPVPDAAVAIVEPPPAPPADAAPALVETPPDAAAIREAKAAPTRPAVAPAPPKPRAEPPSAGSQAATKVVEPPPPQQPQPPLRPLNNPRYSVARAYASMMAWCKVPIDVKHPDPALGKYGVVDWGAVTRKEQVIAKLVDRESYMLLYEVKGHRGTYQFAGDGIGAGTFGTLDVAVGQEVALCVDPFRSERSDIYQLPANWSGGLDLMTAVFPITGTPIVGQLGKLAPVHIDDLKLEISGDKGTLQVKPAAHYLLQAKPIARDGDRWDMKKWWLEVGKVKGADLVAPGKYLWFVIEAPVFEPGPEGEKPRLVARAAMVLEEILPH